MSKPTKRGISSSFRKIVRPPEGETWTWRTLELLQSESWQSLGIHERRIIDRLEIEHLRNGGKENGNLGVSQRQFIEHGVHKDIVAAAIERLVALGLLKVTSEGTGGRGAAHVARYRLTYIGARNVDEHGVIYYTAATNEWKRAPAVKKLHFPKRPWEGIRPGKKQKPTPDLMVNSTPDLMVN